MYKFVLKRIRRSKRQGAFFYIDLDDFKIVNDGFGHDMGDYVLKESANRIKKSLREIDLLYRIGGDEFVAILEPMDKDETVSQVADRIIEGLSAPMEKNGKQIKISASIGIANIKTDSEGLNIILKQTDKAMYAAKQLGKGQYTIYNF